MFFAESLFLSYRKIFKKAVKIGGFLRCLDIMAASEKLI